MNYLKTSLFKSSEELCDVASVIIYCPTDGTLMLVLEQASTEYWIPSVRVSGTSSWVVELNKNIIQDIFGSTPPIHRLLYLNKVWVPNHKTPYICHAVFEVSVNADTKKKSKNPFGKYKNKICWVNEEELKKLTQSNLIKSPEVLHWLCIVKCKTSPIVSPQDEHQTVGAFTEIPEQVLVTGKISLLEQLVDTSKINRIAQETLYKEYLLMTFPCIYLNYHVFTKFLLDEGWPKDDIPHLIYSADVNGRGGVSFKEFLYFLAATEPGVIHGGDVAELRCKYIFRFLDQQKANVLKKEEIKNFIILVRKSRKLSLDPVQIEKDFNDACRLLVLQDPKAITLADFLKGVADMKIRGTSQIYRAPNSIHKFLKEVTDRKRIHKVSDAAVGTIAGGKSASYLKGQPYELAVHSVKIQKSGTVINIEHLWNIEDGISPTSGVVPKPLDDSTRKISIDQFDQESKSNELLKAIRYLAKVNTKVEYYGSFDSFCFKWGDLDPNIVAQNLISVCQEVRKIFMSEPRLLDINSPVYIMGDLHGNFATLLNFERILWHVGPGLCPCNLLFLGDYVDRGLFSLEIICYLFSYKAQSPKKLQLLRGNHEIKKIQQQWTFERECRLKFGDRVGVGVFSAVNEVFDTMPLAAVIDGRVFCCHGGIPPPWLCPVATAINDIPAVLHDPQEQSSLAWELMWNDPIRSKTITEKATMEMLANEGFAANVRRGTGHIFSVEALEKFLKANGFTHLVRSHELVEAGFYLQQKGQLLTVFSSSRYCGGHNMAACVLADQGKLRVLRLEIE